MKCSYKEEIRHPAPIRSGYTFDCWKDKDGTLAKAGQRYVVTGDHEFTAVWKKVSPFRKGQPLKGAVKAMKVLPDDSDPDGTVFRSLRPGSTKQTKSSVKLRWKKVRGAVRYNVYAAKCGAKYKLTRVASVKGTSKTIKKINGKKLKKGRTFKLKAKAVKQFKKKTVKKHRAMRYESGNKKIVTVNKRGTIRAVSKGTCYVCAYAQNGVCKRIKVTVR